MNTDDLQEKLQSGWIKLYRTSTEHWIFPKNKPLTQFEAWIVMLLEVNHTDNKIQYGYDIIECKRGDSLNSLDRWSQIFNWHKSKVRRFFKMLEKDSMIVLNECKKTTHITICNYDKYQGERHESDTQVKRKRHASETQATPNKNDNKDNKDNNDNKLFNEFWDKYHLITGKQKTDKEPTLKHWNKLNDADRRKAIDNIENYTKSLSDKKYCKKARTYLADKNFNDEFEIAVNGKKKYIQYYKYGSPAQYILIEQWDRFYSMEKEQITSYKEVLR